MEKKAKFYLSEEEKWQLHQIIKHYDCMDVNIGCKTCVLGRELGFHHGGSRCYNAKSTAKYILDNEAK